MKLRIMLVKDEKDHDNAQVSFTDSDGEKHTLDFSECNHVTVPLETVKGKASVKKTAKADKNGDE